MSGVSIRTGGSSDLALLRFDRSFSPPRAIPRICARKLSLHPNSPVPSIAAFLKKFLRELLIARSPELFCLNLDPIEYIENPRCEGRDTFCVYWKEQAFLAEWNQIRRTNDATFSDWSFRGGLADEQCKCEDPPANSTAALRIAELKPATFSTALNSLTTGRFSTAGTIPARSQDFTTVANLK